MTQWVRILIFVNVAVFFVQMTVGVPPELAFVPWRFLTRPWSVITYMFLHGGMWHLAFNMLSLYFFGPQVESRLGSPSFARLYFISGVSGALLSALITPRAPIIGASAGVFGVMLAFAHFWPDARIMIWGIIPVPARVLVLLTTVFALMSGLGGYGGGIAHFAHLGGYGGAFLYLRWLERRRGEFRRRATAPSPLAPKLPSTPPVIEMQRVHEVNRDEVNRILDKISAQGMSSLTYEERVFLSHFAPPDDRVPPSA